MSAGAIIGAGVGPGDPGLLTVRAVEALREAGAILAPAPRRGGDSLALSIARPHLREGCDVHTAHFPMTEDPEVLAAAWDEAAATLLRLAAASSPAVFITLGDAMLYSTWSYVLAAVRRADPDADVQTIPGITAMSACAAAVGRPLAEGRDPLLVWPDEPPVDAASLLDLAPNVVFMKAGRHLEDLADVAENAGAEAVAVRRASQSEARVTDDLRAWPGERDYFTTVLMHRTEVGASEGAPEPALPCEEACS
jgi:precorrin-2/cobalt-factor-2 C20-methyltransferase